ncbi:hypothetical protein [Halopiger xanaduensis]|uniref:Uncharacterized protein n=1 Tax=Halopiger xanaduensis (strain DSM 18323 / JCM 14033 / SH-6) TaxID=797210 RepID=F8D2U5_HALXS|nr:hypothetical protein [Halopiger xanaduensis]AEH36088.1 hypothetical protein Halxa_1455 [Halopiger xanaduensis SH-6]
MELIDAHIDDVGSKNGQRRVVVSVDGTKFGVFDGYKQSKGGALQVATAEWLEQRDAEVLLMGTMTTDVVPVESEGRSIDPSTDNPTGWQDHAFQGTVEAVVDDTATLLEEIRLVDGFEPGDRGQELDPASFENLPSAVISLGCGAMLLDLSDVDQEVTTSEHVRFVSSRMDVLGYRLP